MTTADRSADATARPKLRMVRARTLDAVVLIAVSLVLWQALHEMMGAVAITSPVATFAHLFEMMGDRDFGAHVWATLEALIYAVVISALGGVVIGLALGFHRLSGDVADPILAALYSIPKVTLYPVVLLIFGLGLSAKAAFGVIHGIIPIVIFTMNAVRTINPVYLKTARALHLSRRRTVLTVLVPAIIPEMMTGLRIGFSLTLLGVVIGELFASKNGLGFLITNAINLHDVPTMMAVIVLLFTFAIVTNTALLWLDRRLHRRL